MNIPEEGGDAARPDDAGPDRDARPVTPDGSARPDDAASTRTSLLRPGRPTVGKRRPSRGVRTRGRIAAVLGVVVVVASAATVDAVVEHPRLPATPAFGDGSTVTAGTAVASSWACAGGTVGSGSDGVRASPTYYLTNTTDHVVTGTMSSVVDGGSHPSLPAHQAVSVPALGSTAVRPPTSLPSGAVASSFVLAGGGVGVTEVVAGPTGWSRAPCASLTSPTWYFAGGSTSGTGSLELELFNPTVAVTVVDVSFATPTGVVDPANYQGLVIPPGGVLTENVGTYVQDRSEIATIVQAASGQLVADETQEWVAAPGKGLSVRLGSPAASDTWQFAQTTDLAGSTVTFHLFNPGASASVATLTFHLARESVVPVELAVPAQSIVDFASSTASRVPAGTPYALTVTSGRGHGLVVARSVAEAGSGSPPTWGASSGTVTLARHWLVPAPGVPGAPGITGAAVTSLAVSDPGHRTAHVVVSEIGDPKFRIPLAIAGGGVVVLGSSLVRGLATYELRSDIPVAVEEDAAPTAGPGIVAFSGLPMR